MIKGEYNTKRSLSVITEVIAVLFSKRDEKEYGDILEEEEEAYRNGFVPGMDSSQKKSLVDVAKRMRDRGCGMEEIEDVTGLSDAEIRNL